MALLLRRGVERLGRAALAMPLEQYAQHPARVDAADSGPDIAGAADIIHNARVEIAGATGNVAGKVHRNSKAEFVRLGIDLREAEPKFDKLIDRWRGENVDRAQALLGFERDKLSEILSKGEGKTVETLRRQIEGRLDVGRAKADLLARDQVLKLNANITRERQVAAGITDYIWTTSNDERVRDTHAELDGETFSWDDPPVTNDAGDRNHPGDDYQCRCIAYPVLPELGDVDDLPDVEEPEQEPEPELAPEPRTDPQPPLLARAAEFSAGARNPEQTGHVARAALREQIESSVPGAVSKDLGKTAGGQLAADDATLSAMNADGAHYPVSGKVVMRAELLRDAAAGMDRLAASVARSCPRRTRSA